MNELMLAIVETKALEVATYDQQNCQLNRSIYLSLIYLSAAPVQTHRSKYPHTVQYFIRSRRSDVNLTAYGTLYSANFSFYRSKTKIFEPIQYFGNGNFKNGDWNYHGEPCLQEFRGFLNVFILKNAFYKTAHSVALFTEIDSISHIFE
jgi:hypothetical protein